jgi:methionyl-tRNA formyltransferase
MLTVAFAGTPEFAVPVLQAIADSPHRLIGVLTQPDRPAGRGRELRAGPVKLLAQRLGVALAQPATLKSESEQAALRDWAPDVLVVVAYGLILPSSALRIPRLGGINVHASLLPRWRGAAPVQRAILAGDQATGVTIMQMAAGLDTGPMLKARRLELDGTESTQQLLERLAPLGAAALLETLDAIEAGTVSPVEQPADGVTYAAKIQKGEAQIHWGQPAQQLSRQVRAFNPWPVAQTLWEGQQLRVWEATAVEAGIAAGAGASLPDTPGRIIALEQERLLVHCGQGVLALQKLQLAGRRIVTAREFAANRVLAGAQFG